MLQNTIKSFAPNTKLGNVITQEEIANWSSDVIFDCATASGKSTFILNNLSEYCIRNSKKILFLCNRIEIKNEMLEKVKDDIVQVIDIQTYQWLQTQLKLNRKVQLNYDYIACDEASHFLETFDLYTDLSFDYIINHPARKIFMSATATPLFDYLTSEKYVTLNNYYHIQKDYSYVDSFVFYRKANTYLDIVNHLYETTNDKIIYFTSNLDRAVELYRKYPNDSTFYCSPSTSHSEAKEIYESSSNKINNNTFDSRLLVSSRVLDMGITLLDKDIKHIICDIFDITVLQQCIGRKRLVDEDDRCNIYIRIFNKGQLNVFRSNEIDAMRLFDKDEELCHRTYYSDREYSNKYIYIDKETGKQKLNKLALMAINYSEELLDEMMYEEWETSNGDVMEGKGHEWVLLETLGVNAMTNSIKEWNEIEEVNNKMTLENYLYINKGKRYYKDDKDEIINLINLRDGRNRLQKNLNLLNSYLEANGYQFRIVSNKDSNRKLPSGDSNPNYQKSYWTIIG